MTLTFRPLVPADQEQLWEWLLVSLWDPPPTPMRPRAVLEFPHVRLYAQAWGQPGDVGVVAQVDGADAGACWMRLLPAGEGFAHVDADTPQLGIALEPPYQHRGFGTPLMQQALARAREQGYKQVALTVHPQNPAIRIYERCGFRKIGERSTFHHMLATF